MPHTFTLNSFVYFCAVIPSYINQDILDKIITDAIKEDIGDGDHSTLAVIPEAQIGEAELIAKEDGVIAGIILAEKVLHTFDSSLQLKCNFKDGDQIVAGDIVMTISGKARSILSSERLLLNFMQRMSGIATYTRILVDKIADYPTKLLDTRKTTPNLRMIEKWAVMIGGGTNHRIGLFDMIMLKDNHIDFAGGILKAAQKAKEYLLAADKELKIEVETRNIHEVKEAMVAGNVDIIMLDNMNIEEMKQAVKFIDGKIKTEASGNVSEKNIADVASCGVDFISVGALTHTVKSLDLSLKTKL